MTSDPIVYVWIWLAHAIEPVVAGRIVSTGKRYDFIYGKSYLNRVNAISIFSPELPLQAGVQAPIPRLDMANCLRDGLPDRWGRRVIINRLTSISQHKAHQVELSDLTYMLESGSDRIGALDFQTSPEIYTPRKGGEASLEELILFSEKIEAGVEVPLSLEQAILHGSSIGGARPKALLNDAGRKLIAKFSASNDTYSVVKTEFIAMRLAALAGMDVAKVELRRAGGKDALIIERFDRIKRTKGWSRRAMVSALTILGEAEISAHHASYGDLANAIRKDFNDPSQSLIELFNRMVFNILVGNTDDHLRNTAAFWDGQRLSLTPAYDIAPQFRAIAEANQAITIIGRDRRSLLINCLEAADQFHLSRAQAREIIDHQIDVILHNWVDMIKVANLSAIDKNLIEGRIFLNASIFEDYGLVPGF